MNHPLVNTQDYSAAQLILFGVAAAYWVWVYIVVVIDIFKYKFVGIPALAVCANFAWEFLWSFKFYTNMGSLFEWGYRCWFILDVFIFYSLFRYGKIQFGGALLKKKFSLIIIFAFLAWVCGIYAFTIRYADPIGAVSAYLVNTNMSAIYILLILKFPLEKSLSISTAWHKMLGTAFTSVFCFWVFTHEYFMLVLAVITFVLDMVYIYLVTKLKGQPVYDSN
ncbi:MAG TPA: hypothetical protein VGI43_19760 [Mucilaginibacter sp.]|jgi:hypothetical protein